MRQWLWRLHTWCTGITVLLALMGCGATTPTPVLSLPPTQTGATNTATPSGATPVPATMPPTATAASPPPSTPTAAIPPAPTATAAPALTNIPTATVLLVPAGTPTVLVPIITEAPGGTGAPTRDPNSAKATLAVTTATSAADIAAASPASNRAASAAALAVTVTAVAQGVPRPVTPTFVPAPAPPAVATTAARTIAPAIVTPTGNAIPKEGTALSIPNPTAMAMSTAVVSHPLPPPEGVLIPVGRRRLWIACDGSGGPTVIMDAGVNSGSQAWSLVQPGIAKFTRVCVYDRAGLGRSDPIPRPRTSNEVVSDLHNLLTNAEIPGPYVLVAHSFGGLNVRLYTAQFPKDVVGMVLVDPVHEDRFAATSKVLTPTQEKEFEQGREGNPEGLDYYESSTLVRMIGKALPDIPLIVIARGRAEPWPPGWPVDALEKVWRDLETDLASRAPQGKLVIADQSNHNIPGFQPQIIVDATRQVVDELRKSGRK